MVLTWIADKPLIGKHPTPPRIVPELLPDVCDSDEDLALRVFELSADMVHGCSIRSLRPAMPLINMGIGSMLMNTSLIVAVRGCRFVRIGLAE